jgi:hypothetical protein
MQLSNSFLLNFRHENALSYEYKIHTRNGNIATLDWNRDWFYQWLSGYDLNTCFLSLTDVFSKNSLYILKKEDCKIL